MTQVLSYSHSVVFVLHFPCHLRCQSLKSCGLCRYAYASPCAGLSSLFWIGAQSLHAFNDIRQLLAAQRCKRWNASHHVGSSILSMCDLRQAAADFISGTGVQFLDVCCGCEPGSWRIGAFAMLVSSRSALYAVFILSWPIRSTLDRSRLRHGSLTSAWPSAPSMYPLKSRAWRCCPGAMTWKRAGWPRWLTISLRHLCVDAFPDCVRGASSEAATGTGRWLSTRGKRAGRLSQASVVGDVLC